MKPRGKYNSSTTYEKYDVVNYNGSSYVADDTGGNGVLDDSGTELL